MLEKRLEGAPILAPTDSFNAIVPVFCFGSQCSAYCSFELHDNGYLVSITVNTQAFGKWITKPLTGREQALSPLWELDQPPVVAQLNSHLNKQLEVLPGKIGVP